MVWTHSKDFCGKMTLIFHFKKTKFLENNNNNKVPIGCHNIKGFLNFLLVIYHPSSGLGFDLKGLLYF